MPEEKKKSNIAKLIIELPTKTREKLQRCDLQRRANKSEHGPFSSQIAAMLSTSTNTSL